MNGTTEEKRMLIESMKKLVTHVSNNPQRQLEIFEALSLQDLNKIITNFKDENEYLRRISALLLCELLYLNPQTKASAIRMLAILPSSGRICLSGIPQSILKHPATIKKCIELMQEPHQQDQEDKMCWVINIERKGLKLQLLDYKKYSSFTFLDPLKNLFGITIMDRQIRQLTLESDRRVESLRIKTVADSPLRQSTQMNSQFYKSYIDARNKSKDSNRSSFVSNYIAIDMNESTDKKQYTRPITSRLNVNPYNSKREELNTSLDVHKPNTIQNISQFARNSYGGAKVASHRPSDPPLSSPFKPNETYHLASDSKYHETLRQREIQTDRKIEGRQTLRPATNKQILNDHQKFYKRVKEILKK